jgi:hypothetical protein
MFVLASSELFIAIKLIISFRLALGKSLFRAIPGYSRLAPENAFGIVALNRTNFGTT